MPIEVEQKKGVLKTSNLNLISLVLLVYLMLYSTLTVPIKKKHLQHITIERIALPKRRMWKKKK